MVIPNTKSGKVVTTLRIGESVDANVSDKGTQQIFSSRNDGTLTTIKEQSADLFIVQQNATTQRGARTMALNPINHDVYLVSAELDETQAADPTRPPMRTMRPNTFTLRVMRKSS